jgi:hypothetical protein
MQRDLPASPFARKQDRKPTITDRLALWITTARMVDGLWVGSTESKPRPGLRRVEDALQLIKRHDALHYSRVINNIERIWVHLLPDACACYSRSLNACVLDERFVLRETTTLEWIACAIVHEATHVRLERWGIGYDEEKARTRIEAICLRRELNFVAKLSHSEPLREEIARTLEWCVSNRDYFSNVSLQQRTDQGQVETLRYLGTPNWLFNVVLKVRVAISEVRRLANRCARLNA